MQFIQIKLLDWEVVQKLLSEHMEALKKPLKTFRGNLGEFWGNFEISLFWGTLMRPFREISGTFWKTFRKTSATVLVNL